MWRIYTYVFVFTDLHHITIRKGVVPILGTYGCRIRIDSLNSDLAVPIECRKRKAMFLTYGRMTFRHQVTKTRRSGQLTGIGCTVVRKSQELDNCCTFSARFCLSTRLDVLFCCWLSGEVWAHKLRPSVSPMLNPRTKRWLHVSELDGGMRVRGVDSGRGYQGIYAPQTWVTQVTQLLDSDRDVALNVNSLQSTIFTFYILPLSPPPKNLAMHLKLSEKRNETETIQFQNSLTQFCNCLVSFSSRCADSLTHARVCGERSSSSLFYFILLPLPSTTTALAIPSRWPLQAHLSWS